MTKAAEAAAKLNSPKELAAFLVSPKDYVKSRGVDPEDKASSQVFEHYARALIENVNAANRAVGVSDLKDADWGIGAGCCNSRAMTFR